MCFMVYPVALWFFKAFFLRRYKIPTLFFHIGLTFEVQDTCVMSLGFRNPRFASSYYYRVAVKNDSRFRSSWSQF